MSEKTVVWIGVGVGLMTLYVTWRMASGLQKVSNDVDAFKSNPAGGVVKFFQGY